jgi:endo-1,4-beta-xylanase
MCGYRSLRPGPPAPSPAPPVPPSPPGMTLRGAGKTHGVFIGAASQAHLLTSDAKYTQLLKGQYSLTTAENGCKVGPIHPQRGNYTWEQCDQVFATAEAAGQAVRGHNLCWHTENPGWLNNGNFTPAELSEILQEHITTVVKHYGTRAYW